MRTCGRADRGCRAGECGYAGLMWQQLLAGCPTSVKIRMVEIGLPPPPGRPQGIAPTRYGGGAVPSRGWACPSPEPKCAACRPQGAPLHYPLETSAVSLPCRPGTDGAAAVSFSLPGSLRHANSIHKAARKKHVLPRGPNGRA